MLGAACRGVGQQSVVRHAAWSWLSAVNRKSLHTAAACRTQEVTGSSGFDRSVLQFLVCPLSRKALRYDESTNELINEELGIAYPIVDGIPNMIAQDARMIHKEKKEPDTQQ